MKPRLSVVVPFYNVEDYIGDCLDSLVRQTFDDFEVILVDDGSRDGSGVVAKSFCERDHRFRLVMQENQGLGPARNTGTRHAEGEYLTFVDSDDLVTRHAYEIMVRSLDETGSSFVAGNARRFNNTGGVRPSWVHTTPFALDRPATHVFEFPALARDRMVWNKVYRRSFWDRFGYEFPAIRYEDWPVTLKAHIEAVTVDCLATPVYYWRERESGESITQLKFEYSNLYDRVVSAELVLDMIDEKAPELRGEVQGLLAEIDLTALVLAFSSVPEHEQDKLIQLGQRLARRLDRQLRRDVTPYDRLQYHALQAGDVDLLRRLAQFRLDGGLRGGTPARRHPVLPWRFENQYPGLKDHPRPLPSKLYQLPRPLIDLYNSVTSIGWDDGDLIVRGTAEIRHLVNDEKSTLRVSLVHDEQRFPLEISRFEAVNSHGVPADVGFEARVPRAVLAGLPLGDKLAHFQLEMRRGLLRRQSKLRNLRPGNPHYPLGAWVTDDVWIQPTRAGNGQLVLMQMLRPYELTSARVEDGAFVLSGRLPGVETGAQFRLSRSSGGAVMPMQIQNDDGPTFTARLPLDAIHDAANPDDPFTQRTVRVPSVGEGDQNWLLATGLDRSVSAVHDGRLFRLTRSPANYVNLHEGPVRPVAETLEVGSDADGPRVTVGGPRLEAGTRFVWRRFFDNSNDYVDAQCQVSGADEHWSAGIALAELLPTAEMIEHPPLDPQAGLIDWTLFAEHARGESAYAVQLDVFLIDRLPIELQVDGRRIKVQPRASTVHLQIY
ncbi:glycosyltransferase family 2 protein [Paractinoplanes globisporus]|uniref:Glycosyltransferase family 2 protein n=1 Tax=Paractinoplanes globisporus TaxID=113565 RepID=A0ABW6WUQ1_9ACTN|nr:glycosyltransferase family 2 protein [Actinoplanes globisporus]